MNIRDYINIVERHSLSEAAWKLAYAYGYRSWYHPERREWIKVEGMSSHARMVARNPALFGIDCNMDHKHSCSDSDSEVMNMAFALGWLRVAGYDRNNPQKFMIVDGADMKQVIRLAKMFYHDMGGELENVNLKVRTLNGEEGVEYTMRGVDEVKAGLVRGDLPVPHAISALGTAA